MLTENRQRRRTKQAREAEQGRAVLRLLTVAPGTKPVRERGRFPWARAAYRAYKRGLITRTQARLLGCTIHNRTRAA
jgi:hypothetical protein